MGRGKRLKDEREEEFFLLGRRSTERKREKKVAVEIARRASARSSKLVETRHAANQRATRPWDPHKVVAERQFAAVWWLVLASCQPAEVGRKAIQREVERDQEGARLFTKLWVYGSEGEEVFLSFVAWVGFCLLPGASFQRVGLGCPLLFRSAILRGVLYGRWFVQGME